MTAQIYKRLPISDDAGFLHLCHIFEKHNAKIYAVGGSVRDSFLNSNFDMTHIDIDISTPLTPPDVIEILTLENIKYLTIGLEFGTITAIIDTKPYEITSFRQDITTNGRHAVVAYTSNITFDAARRDFTLNALYYDHTGIIYDPLGQGVNDLKTQTIRFIGTPHNRITEDYLRILRYFRFLARFGVHGYTKELFETVDYKPFLQKLSPHRIINELNKLICYPYAHDALALLCALDYHTVLFKGLKLNIEHFRQFQTVNPVSDYLLSCLLLGSDKNNINQSPLLSRKDRTKAIAFSKLYMLMQEYSHDNNWADLLELQYDYDISLWRDMLSLIDSEAAYPQIQTIKNTLLPEFTLSGRDLLAAGHPAGKQIASILKQRRNQFVQDYCQENGLSCD